MKKTQILTHGPRIRNVIKINADHDNEEEIVIPDLDPSWKRSYEPETGPEQVEVPIMLPRERHKEEKSKLDAELRAFDDEFVEPFERW